MLKNCAICGKEFEARGGAVYCSEVCRSIGAKRSRRKWVHKNNYNEARREKALRAREEKERETAEQLKIRRADAAERIKGREKQLQEKAAAGDPMSRLLLAKRRGNKNIEYWEAFRDCEISWAEENGVNSETTVNRLSVYLPDFAERVLQSIEEGDAISISTRKPKRAE